MKRTIRVTVLVVGIVALAVVGLAEVWPRVPLDAAPTNPGAPPAVLVCSGSVDTGQGTLLLQPARAGRVAAVLVKEGQTVCKDAALVQLDDHLVKLQEHEAELAVQSAQLQLAKAQNGLKQHRAKQAQLEAALHAAHAKVVATQSALARKEELAGKELINPADVDMGRALLAEAQALVGVEQNRLVELEAVDPELEVRLARTQLEHSRAQRDRACQERSEYLLRAPVTGTVLRVQAQDGDLAGPTSPRPAVWLAPAGGWIVRAEVSQEFAGRVHAGMAVRVEDEANGDALAEGRVAEVSDWFLPRRQISTQPTGINTGLTSDCVIELREPHASLRLGQHVRVRIVADQPIGGSGKSGAGLPSSSGEHRP
jgi:multidrug efflux pump subunit AcrA (membrane-fusion protein)